MVRFIGNTFPRPWIWGGRERTAIVSILNQIKKTWPNDRSMLVNLTWFGANFPGRAQRRWQLELARQRSYDRLLLLSTIDPTITPHDARQNMAKELGVRDLLLLGNFDGQYQFNLIATAMREDFTRYAESEVRLHQCEHVFVNYNRKPHAHRVGLVRRLVDHDLHGHGVITLGRQDGIHDGGPNHDLYFSIGERNEDYVDLGHWFPLDDPGFGDIPHDLLSLGRIDIWQTHFLNVVSETEFDSEQLFVSEKTFKPIIGLRPFVINGDVRTYQYLRDHGFRTFERWFGTDIEDQAHCHVAICDLIARLSKMSRRDIELMYNDMYKDLLHNRERFDAFAREQLEKRNNLFH